MKTLNNMVWLLTWIVIASIGNHAHGALNLASLLNVELFYSEGSIKITSITPTSATAGKIVISGRMGGAYVLTAGGFYSITGENSATISYNSSSSWVWGDPTAITAINGTIVVGSAPGFQFNGTVREATKNARGTARTERSYPINDYFYPAGSPPPVQKPIITSAADATATVGQPFSYQITALNSPTSYGATGSPSGLAVNTGTGQITGTPTASGTFMVSLSAANAGGAGNQPLTLTVNPAPNQNPTIALTSSANTVTQGQAVTLTATARDNDGAVVKVEFFAGATKLGENTAFPFSWVVSTLPVGTHSVTAKATDDKGAATTSTAVSITVSAAPSLPAFLQTPGPRLMPAGTEVRFEAAATNAQSYQWFFGSSPLAGATNASLTLTNVQRTASGVYAVVASNAAGSVTNRDAVLRVMAPKRLQPPQSLGNGRFRLTFGHQDGGAAGADDAAKLAVQVSTRLFPPTWVTLTNEVTVTDGQFAIEGTLPSGTSTHFFRIIEQ